MFLTGRVSHLLMTMVAFLQGKMGSFRGCGGMSCRRGSDT